MSDTTAWLTVGALFLATIAVKSVGPVLTGGRTLPPRALDVIVLMPAALLAALVVTEAFVQDGRLDLGAETLGVAAAAVAIWRGVGVIGVIVVAAVVTAAARAAGIA